MAMTITEKILAAHAGKNHVEPGDLITSKVDIVLGNDITAPVAIKEFQELNVGVFDKERIMLVPDHFTPNKDIKSAEQVKVLREFAKKHDITNYFEVGQMGIEHCLLPEKGLVVSGDVVIGADSHTCTYGGLGAFATGVGSTDMAAAMATGEIWFKVPASIKFEFQGDKFNKWVSGKDLILQTIGDIGVDGALYNAMEFTGEGISALSVEGRMTMANMAIEAGGKNGIFAPDAKTEAFMKDRAQRPYKMYQSDDDAKYEKEYIYKTEDILPQVAFPHLPENTKNVADIERVHLDQVVIGSCTNGRIEDLRIAAQILKGKTVCKNLRCIVIPGTQAIAKQAIKEGLAEIFIDAGAVFSTPTCGPCLGGHMGILAKGERALATTNRNFVGRMGHPESEVYLCNPAIAAASAIMGWIATPEEV